MSPPPRQTVWWVMSVLLAVIATALVMRLDDTIFARNALAQSAADTGASPMVGARGIYAFTGQLSSKSYGLFMLDVDAGTIWCYELEKSRDGELRLRLAAARSWIFDRHLEEFNVGAPTPSEVRVMVQRQTSHASSVASPPISATGQTPANEPALDLSPPGDASKVALPKGEKEE